MNPLLAEGCFMIMILGLLWLDRRSTGRISKTMWVPLVWLLIGSSRPLTEWFLGLQQGANYEDGTPLDRAVLTILLSLAVVTLYKRRSRVAPILRANLPLVAFFGFCLASVIWSDFGFVTFKRWIRGVADVCMILVVITEPNWEEALRWLLTRIAFVLIPLSVLIIKFFPAYGRSYTISGATMWTGVCTDKNALGAICMIFGSALLWQILRIPSQQLLGRNRRNEFIAKATVFAMNLYLIWVIDSKTALICFLFANGMIVLTWSSRRVRRKTILTLIVVATVISCFCVLFLGIGSSALTQMGRRSDLTGRTEIWATVLPLATNPVLGAGYENFWMGERFATVARSLARLNQAHNGYLEIYLNLGWVGLVLLGMLVVTGYRNLMRGLYGNFDIGRLKLILFTICLIYNFTEATFKMQSPVWITFLWATMATVAPKKQARRSPLIHTSRTDQAIMGWSIGRASGASDGVARVINAATFQ
jgi:exopolysaccharide production protein ExoQ